MNRSSIALFALAAFAAAACGRKQAPVTTPPAPAAATTTTTTAPALSAPTTTTRVDDRLPVPAQPPLADEGLTNRALSLDDLNRNSPFSPVYFQLDSAELDDVGRTTASANAEILKKNPTWVVTIEGHCDERGSAEYNLALGERRAAAVQTFLTSLGIPASRVRVVSYGNEFPFDTAHNEAAWAKNRRGEFVITSR